VAIQIPYRKGTSPQLLHPIPPSRYTLIPRDTLGHLLACGPLLITQVSHLELSGQVVADNRYCRTRLDEYSDTNATERIVQLLNWTSRICNLLSAIRPPPPSQYTTSHQTKALSSPKSWPQASDYLQHLVLSPTHQASSSIFNNTNGRVILFMARHPMLLTSFHHHLPPERESHFKSGFPTARALHHH
jgi:hypothetical protein